MALYYPQTVTLDLGPTGIVPSRYSHAILSSTHCMAATEVDQPLTVEAGSVVLIHGDTWHRAMSNTAPEGSRRFMLKFYFVRMQEPWMAPASSSWDHRETAEESERWWAVDGAGMQDDDAAQATWRWLLGRAAVSQAAGEGGGGGLSGDRASVAALEEDSGECTEQQRIAAILESARCVASERTQGIERTSEALLEVLRSPATAEAVDGILTEAWSHSTNEWRGLRRHSKACNPSGTNPAGAQLTIPVLASEMHPGDMQSSVSL
jgi:hypothetical protein